MSTAGRPSPLDVRIRFERFPLALKGAFVMQGADGNPHAARIVEAAIARIPPGPRYGFDIEDRIVDVAPNRDLFVPFEAPVTDLASGWYDVETSVEIDGRGPWPFAGRPFTVPWPRTEVRRGTVRVDRVVDAAEKPVRLLRFEMGPDSAALVWETPGVNDMATVDRLRSTLSASVDGGPLDVLPEAAGPGGAPGETVMRTYPVPRNGRQVDVVVTGSGREPAVVHIPLS